MAFAEVNEELSCSICLNIYSDPIMLSCGHNFCCACIGNVLDVQDSSGMYSCPQCRAEFKERPALQRNITLRNIAGYFLSAPPQQVTSGIFCTYCINSSVPAIKMCVNCEASLCTDHMKVHSKSEEHMLIEPTTCLETRKCHVHKKILEYYCSEDSVCICASCGLEGAHRGHPVASIHEAFKEKKETLKRDLESLLQKRLEDENRVQSLLDHNSNVERRAASIKQKVNDKFLEMQKELDALKESVLAEISRQEMEVSNSVANLIQQLKAELDDISKKIINAEKLGTITDPLQLLQDQGVNGDLDVVIKKGNWENFPGTSNEDVGVADLDEGLMFITLMDGFSDLVNQEIVIQEDLLLDDDTAGNYLDISRDFKMASPAKRVNCYPQTPKRFANNQVLSKASISSGCHYWQMETGKAGTFRFGIAYCSIDRKDSNTSIGNNNKSWCLRRAENKYSVCYDKEEIHLPYTPSCQNLGVYLDYEAGRLSFYELGDVVRHLYTFTTTFTEPLYAAFLLLKNFVKIKRASNFQI